MEKCFEWIYEACIILLVLASYLPSMLYVRLVKGLLAMALTN